MKYFKCRCVILFPVNLIFRFRRPIPDILKKKNRARDDKDSIYIFEEFVTVAAVVKKFSMKGRSCWFLKTDAG